jgi:hypothetical protein
MTNGSLSPSGDVEVVADSDVEIIQDPLAGDVEVGSEDVLTEIITGDQGPPGPRGNAVLYGHGQPTLTTGVNGDFYIDLNTALFYGPKIGGTWPPGFSLIGPIGPQGIPGPAGPVGAPGNTIRNGSGPPDPSFGNIGDFYIDTTNHNIYGPKSSTVTNWGSPTSIIGPAGPTGPIGPVGPPTWTSPPTPWAPNTAYTMGPPASLVTNAGASYAPNAGHISGTDFATDNAAGLWTLVAAAGSPGQTIAQVYVGDTAPTGIQNNSLWWNSTDGCLYVYYFDGNSHQWVIAAPIPDLGYYLQLTGGTMTGNLILNADPTATNQAATKHYVDTQAAFPEAPNDGFDYGRKSLGWDKVVPLAGGTMTGLLTLSGDPSTAGQAATKNYVDTHAITDAPNDGFFYGRSSLAWGKVVALTGGTMTGLLTLSADPSTALQAATKQYADTKAPIASPAFTGNPTAPTQAVDDNSTKLATTAYVTNQASAAGDGTPAMDGTAARGVATHWARADHIHPADTTRAPIASPTFTGDPKAPTAAQDDNDTSLATTAYVIGQASAANPTMNGAVAPGAALRWSRGDHVHPIDTSRAPTVSPAFTGTVDIQQALTVSGAISPTSLAANVNDYAPPGFATASVLRMTAGGLYNVTGLAGGSNGRVIAIYNIGTNPITLTNEDAASLAANRFSVGANVSLGGSQGLTLIYDATAQRWRMITGSGSGGGAAVFTQDSAPATTVPAGSLWWQTSTGLLFVLFNDGNSTQWVFAGNMLPNQNPTMYVAGGRFQINGASPSTSCILVPYVADAMRIQGLIYSIPGAGIVITNSGLTAGTKYYCYAYVSGGAIALEWSTTGHVTDTTPGNVGTEIKSGDNSRTLVGMAFYTAAANFQDTQANRLVRSWYNRPVAGMLSAQLGGNTGINATMGEVSSVLRVNFVAWAGETISWQSQLTHTTSTAGIALSSQLWLDGANFGNGSAINTDGTGHVLPMGSPVTAGPVTEALTFHVATIAASISTGSCSMYTNSHHALTLSPS